MKTTKIMMAAALAAMTLASCEKIEKEEPQLPIEPEMDLAILTFEDKDWKGESYSLTYCEPAVAINTWSDLIDKQQYMGNLIYKGKENDTYRWYDKGNTELKHIAGPNFWDGGHAISNYIARTIENVNYEQQLSLYVSDSKVTAAGHNGSKNFCIHNGYTNAYMQFPPALEFGDGKARTIAHMWITNTAYTLNEMLNGEKKLGTNSEVYIIATGYNGDEKTGTSKFFLAKGKDNIVTDWSFWNLSELGNVTRIVFDMNSSADLYKDGSMYIPGYFAYDDVAVVME